MCFHNGIKCGEFICRDIHPEDNERTCKVEDIRSTYEGFSTLYVILSCGHRYLTMLSRPFPRCPECGAKVVE